MPPASASLLIVGDVHQHWRRADRRFLEAGDQELVLFVGDLGDENVDLVREIADVRADKAVILGNHDAWASFTGKSPSRRLRQSLEALGDDHIAYAVREAPRASVSVVGARPFSWGGPGLRSREVYQELYGVRDTHASARKIHEAARQAQHRDLVVLAHNGPTGLGDAPEDFCGKDFGRRGEPVGGGGDWGDKDLAEALSSIAESGWRVPCVVAGHMHSRLMHRRDRERTRFVRRAGTVFVNAAVVPRWSGERGYYVRLRWQAGSLAAIEEVWIDAEGREVECVEPEIVDLD